MKHISKFVAALLCAFVLALAFYQPSSEADDGGNTTKREMAGFRATGELPLPKAMAQPLALTENNANIEEVIQIGTTKQISLFDTFTEPVSFAMSWAVVRGTGNSDAVGYSQDGVTGNENGWNVTSEGSITVPIDAEENGVYTAYYQYNRDSNTAVEQIYRFRAVKTIDPTPPSCSAGTHDDGTGNCVPDTDPPPTPNPSPSPSPTSPPDPSPSPVPSPTTPPDPTPSPIPSPNPSPSPSPTAVPTPAATPTLKWAPEEKEIGYKRVGETWVADGRMTAPVDQRSANSTVKVVAAGTEVPCAVEVASDYDTLTTTFDGTTTKSYGVDGPLTYTWSASQGKFKGGVNGLTATWIAPDDITEPTNVMIRCTIDDPPGDRVNAPETGSHDDEPTVRVATVKVMNPTVEFKGAELVNNTIRACAGGIDEHAQSDFQYRAHTRKIEMEVKLNDAPMKNARFTLRFQDNKGHDYGDGREKKMARLHKTNEAFDAAHPWQESLEMTASAQGKVSVWVLSSDVINKPTLQAILKPVAAPAEPVKLGEIGCDFAASETFRNFANPVDPDDPDDYGWIFDFPKLVNPKAPKNQKPNTPAKVYLKFKVDPHKEENLGNWQFVNGHELLLRVARVASIDFETGQVTKLEGTPEQLKDYAYFSDKLGPAGAASVTRVTKIKGETSPQPYVIAGPELKDSFTIYVRAKDNTEHKE